MACPLVYRGLSLPLFQMARFLSPLPNHMGGVWPASARSPLSPTHHGLKHPVCAQPCGPLWSKPESGRAICDLAHGSVWARASGPPAGLHTSAPLQSGAAHLGKASKDKRCLRGEAKRRWQICLEGNHAMQPKAGVIKKKHATILGRSLIVINNQPSAGPTVHFCMDFRRFLVLQVFFRIDISPLG